MATRKTNALQAPREAADSTAHLDLSKAVRALAAESQTLHRDHFPAHARHLARNHQDRGQQTRRALPVPHQNGPRRAIPTTPGGFMMKQPHFPLPRVSPAGSSLRGHFCSRGPRSGKGDSETSTLSRFIGRWTRVSTLLMCPSSRPHGDFFRAKGPQHLSPGHRPGSPTHWKQVGSTC